MKASNLRSRGQTRAELISTMVIFEFSVSFYFSFDFIFVLVRIQSVFASFSFNFSESFSFYIFSFTVVFKLRHSAISWNVKFVQFL